MQDENEHGHDKSLKILKLIMKHIRNGLFVLRSIELKREMTNRKNWRLIVYMEQK